MADGAAGLAIEVATVLATLISFTLLGRQLGPADYGGFVAMYSLIGIAICIGYVGPGLALLRTAMQANLKRVAGHFFSEQIVFTVVASGVVLALAPHVVPSIGLGTVAMFLTAELVGIALFNLSANLRIVALGYRSALWLQIGPQAVKVVVIVVLAMTSHLTLTTYGLVYMVCTVVAGAIAFKIITASLDVSLRPKAITGENVRLTLSMSSTIWAWGLHDNGDKLVMAANRVGADLGLYSAAYRLVQFGNIPVNALATSSFRSFMDPEVGDQKRRAIHLSVAITVYTSIAALGIVVLAPIALPILVGNKFHGSIAMARWLAPMLIFRGILTFPGNALVGLGRTHARLVAYLSSAAVGMVSYVLLVPSMSWKGAVIGSYITDAVLVTTLWTLLLRTPLPDRVDSQPAGNVSLTVGEGTDGE